MRYLFGFLVAIGLIIMIIVLIFSGGGSKPQTATGTGKQPLYSYANTDAEVSLTIEGPINASEEHEAIRIIVNQDQVTYQQLSGYDGSVIKQQAYGNDEASYSSFLKALNYAGFTLRDSTSSLSDEKGRCATGQRYVFRMDEDDRTLLRSWATNCGGTKTFLGNTQLAISLFQSQVPNYSDLSSTASL